MLLQSGANPDLPGGIGVAAIHLAGEHDATGQMIQVLVEAGANINLQDAQGWTPLHWAVDMAIDGTNQQNHTDIDWSTVKTMLDLGADPNIGDEHGETVADLAAHYGSSAFNAFKQCLLEHTQGKA